MKILVVEDEIILAHTLKEMLFDFGYENVRLAHSMVLAESILTESEVDLAILDINLGKGNEGLQLAEICNKRGIMFFFTTSYTDKETIDNAISKQPGAYLTKPFMESSLYSALQVTLKLNPKIQSNIITLKEGNEIVKLKTDSIIYLRANKNYVEVITKEQILNQRTSLSGMIKLIGNEKIIQVHRSYAVNLNYVVRLKTDSLIVNGDEIPISRSFKDEVKNLLNV